MPRNRLNNYRKNVDFYEAEVDRILDEIFPADKALTIIVNLIKVKDAHPLTYPAYLQSVKRDLRRREIYELNYHNYKEQRDKDHE